MKAVIARFDLITAYGWGVKATWDGLMAGQTAITSSPIFNRPQPIPQKLAIIPDLHVPSESTRARAMLTQLLLPLAGKLDPQTPLILATTVGEVEWIERSVLENKPELIENASPHLLLKYLKHLLGLEGPAMVLSSACTSSTAAIARAARMVEHGSASSVLVIACDAISEFVYSGFSTLLSLCDIPARPFDADRCGLSLGEASAWALVTRADSKLADGNSPSILGWSSTSDAVHMTAPDRAAGGLSRAIANACKMAEIPSDQIDFIAAHGTATIYNDAMELRAFALALRAPVPVFSIKGGTGHTLAAAGLVQILITQQAMRSCTVPPTVGLSAPDPDALGWATTTSVHLKHQPIALSTNSGFGGVNTSLLLGWRDEPKRIIARSTCPAASICAVAWFSRENFGFIGCDGICEIEPAIAPSFAKEMNAMAGVNFKYFARMTDDARSLLITTRLAMNGAGWEKSNPQHVGVLGMGYAGVLRADYDYFQDYADQGRSLGRANLFVYTLPTSALSDVAIALSLTGPTLHIHADSSPSNALIQHAVAMVENHEAAGMLCVCSDGATSICFAVGIGQAVEGLTDFPWNQSTTGMSRHLAAAFHARHEVS